MLDDYRDGGVCTLDNGHRIRFRLPLAPRAPRYRCPQCGDQVTSDKPAEEPGIYSVECSGCKLTTRVVVTVPFFVVLS